MRRSEFKANTVLVGECWVWQRLRSSRGYGLLTVDGRQVRAHRFAWMLYKRRDPAGLMVCHRCDNPPCVNPKYLFLGTAKDNVNDMHRKGRRGATAGFPKGGSHSAITRDKMSASHTGMKYSKEHAANIAIGVRRSWAVRKGETL